MNQVINCIWKHPDARTVYLTCDMLGQEEILVEVSQTFGEKIYVDEAKNLECSKSLELIAPDIVSKDPSSRFQLLDGFPRLYERAEAMISSARANFQSEPLIIRPSSQWYACGEGSSEMEKQRKGRYDQAVRDLYGVWHVCYSIHSSRDELEWALQLLAPKWVVSTTPNCRAMELSYVKKYCFNNERVFSDAVRKLLSSDVSAVISMGPGESVKSLSCTDVDVSILDSYIETQIEPMVISTHQRKRLSLSPPIKRPAIALFGRARLGPHDSTVKYEPNKVLVHNSFVEKSSVEIEDVCLQKEDDTEGKFDELLETKRKVDFEEIECTSTGIVDTATPKPAIVSPISIGNCYNENLRKVYRSMNVPVPQRLPSLVKLMDTKRSLKKRMHN